MTKQVDELSVMRSLMNTLGKLDAESQKRVMFYLNARVPVGQPEKPAPEKQPGLFEGQAS